MMTFETPTEEQIRSFCALVEKTLLEARKRNDPIVLKGKQFTRDVTDKLHYGDTVIDAIFTGARFTAEFGEPAEKSMRKFRMKR